MGQNKEQMRFLRAMEAMAREQVAAGRSVSFIVDDLIAEGLDQPTAIQIANKASGVDPRKFGREKRARPLLHATLWLGGGLVAAVFTLMAAATGGICVIVWAFILMSVIKSFRDADD